MVPTVVAIQKNAKSTRSPERGVAIALVLIRTAVCTYRAATQSFTEDEAYTYGNVLVGSWRDLYFMYEANNHVLFSILSRLSKALFGGLRVRAPPAERDSRFLF